LYLVFLVLYLVLLCARKETLLPLAPFNMLELKISHTLDMSRYMLETDIPGSVGTKTHWRRRRK
jgi:hypothetical protein